MIVIIKMNHSQNHSDENKNYLQIDMKITNRKIPNRIHISTLPSLSAHERAMLRHLHDEKFRKAAQMKFDAINSRER